MVKLRKRMHWFFLIFVFLASRDWRINRLAIVHWNLQFPEARFHGHSFKTERAAAYPDCGSSRLR
jgi:hypothetical protein